MNVSVLRATWSFLITCAVCTGCAGARDLPADDAPSLAVSARAATPSAATAAVLPNASNYHLALGQRGDLGLLVSGPDGRIWARLYVDAGDARGGVHLDFEGRDRDFALDARGQAGVLDGSLEGDELALSWRAAATNGQLVGRRWHAQASRHACDEVRLAHAMADDLRVLGPSLAVAAAWSRERQQALSERLALAELALELSARACERRDRAALPTLTGPFAWR